MQSGTTITLPRDIDADLDHWLDPFLDATGRSTRRKMAPLYVRGLLGSGGRKSVQPMAERLGLSRHDPLHHFISRRAWDDAPLWRVLAEAVDRQVGGAGAVLVVDDVGIPKKGELSVGVARQYCGALGKVANCQVLVSLTLACGEVPLPVGLRLFLPAAWTDDAERCDEAGVPEAARTAQSKPRLAIPPSYAWRNLEPASPEIALAEIDRVRAAGVRFSCVLADAGFGSSPAFRQGLEERELAWAAGIAGTQLVYPTTVKLHPTYTPSGRPAKHPVPNRPPLSAAEMLDKQGWRRITWRTGTKGPLNARFAAVRVRVADGPLNAEDTRLPGEELWLIGEWRDSGEKKYYLSNFPRGTRRARWAPPPRRAWPRGAPAGRHRQGALVLRTGTSAAQAGTGARRLRGPVLDRSASPRLDDLHRLCLSATPAPEGCGSGKKRWGATDRRRSHRCLRSAAPSSPSCSLRLRFLIVARTATGGFFNTLPKCQSSAINLPFPGLARMNCARNAGARAMAITYTPLCPASMLSAASASSAWSARAMAGSWFR